MFSEGLSVDEAFSLFNEGFGVKKSKEMRKEKLALQKTLKETNATGTPLSQVFETTKDDGAQHIEIQSLRV